IWAGRLHAHVQELRRDLAAVMPWLTNQHRGRAGVSGATAMPTWAELAVELRRLQDRARSEPAAAESARAVAGAAEIVTGLLSDAADLAERAGRIFDQTEFGFLYDHGRSVFRIGFDVDNSRLDRHAYDLLASEARVASFLAIATQQAPPAHWLHLARPVSRA